MPGLDLWWTQCAASQNGAEAPSWCKTSQQPSLAPHAIHDATVVELVATYHGGSLLVVPTCCDSKLVPATIQTRSHELDGTCTVIMVMPNYMARMSCALVMIMGTRGISQARSLSGCLLLDTASIRMQHLCLASIIAGQSRTDFSPAYIQLFVTVCVLHLMKCVCGATQLAWSNVAQLSPVTHGTFVRVHRSDTTTKRCVLCCAHQERGREVMLQDVQAVVQEELPKYNRCSCTSHRHLGSVADTAPTTLRCKRQRWRCTCKTSMLRQQFWPCN